MHIVIYFLYNVKRKEHNSVSWVCGDVEAENLASVYTRPQEMFVHKSCDGDGVHHPLLLSTTSLIKNPAPSIVALLMTK